MQTLTALRRLDGRFRFLSDRGRWFWIITILAGCVRVGLAFFSEGTLDVAVWRGHAEEIDARGLMAYYEGGRFTFNHPPMMGSLSVLLLHVCEATGLPFGFLLRAPFVIFDAGTAWLLIALAGAARAPGIRRARFVIGALYWACPLAIIYSAQHGNTDSAVAFFLVAATFYVVRERPLLAGAMIGLGLWIKIPGILAAPALVLALPNWPARLRFVAALGGVGALSYVPALLLDASAVIDSVFLYSGLRIQTTTGAPVWGLQIFYPETTSLPESLRSPYRALVASYYRYNTLICLAPIGLLAWARRRARHAEQIAQTIAGSYALLYGLSNFWAFQYFAWSLPFWFLCGPLLGALTVGIASLYVYGLYAWLCGDLLLLGTWDFIGKPDWPGWIRASRDACVLVALSTGVLALVTALMRAGDEEADGPLDALGTPASEPEREA